MGFDLNQSEQPAQVTAIFEKTTGLDTKDTYSILTSTANTFTEISNLRENDYASRAEAIGDRIHAVQSRYAVDAQALTQGLQNVGANLKAAGNDLDETLSLITVANKISPDADTGNGLLKTATARLNTETDSAILRQKIYRQTGNQVDILGDENTLKSTFQILTEIGAIFDSLPKTSKRAS